MKSILFLTGTRADFGKLKSLIMAVQDSAKFDAKVFATGMHLSKRYGRTIDEIYKSNIRDVFPFINHDRIDCMDRTLAKTVEGLSHFIAEDRPDLIVVHGDRVEALAGALVGSLNNILVAHVEGGEISGTVDELIRHSVSKMAHIHLVSNERAGQRLLQMGELEESVYLLGSPDLDLMLSDKLESLDFVRNYYEIPFKDFGLLLFHPVTTELDDWAANTRELVDAVIESGRNFIAIYPNNDLGSNVILDEYKRFNGNDRFRVFPSLRFEYFLVLLKHAEFIVGNSSAGVREAPYYGVPTLDIGTRQNGRARFPTIRNCGYDRSEILDFIATAEHGDEAGGGFFGDGKSDQKFLEFLNSEQFWSVSRQKQFQERLVNA